VVDAACRIASNGLEHLLQVVLESTMAKRNKRSALRVAVRDVRGVFATSAALFRSWRADASKVMGPVRRLVRRPKSERGTEPDAGEDILELLVGGDVPDATTPAQPEQEGHAAPAALALLSVEDRYRRVVRALIRHIVRVQASAADQQTARKERNEQLRSALRQADAERAALRCRLMSLETDLAIAEARGRGPEWSRRNVRALQRELDEARRRLARAERNRERLEALDGQFSWEVLEDLDADGRCDLASDHLEGS
jgi:hypothetical protein